LRLSQIVAEWMDFYPQFDFHHRGKINYVLYQVMLQELSEGWNQVIIVLNNVK